MRVPVASSIAFLLLIGEILVATGDAAAFTAQTCGGSTQISDGDFKYKIGQSSSVGASIIAVNFTDLSRVKWINFRWIQLDSDPSLVNLESATMGACTHSYTGGEGISSVPFTATSGNDDGETGVVVTFATHTYDASNIFDIFITVSKGQDYRVIPLYFDVDINPSGSASEGTDDQLWFNSDKSNNEYEAEQTKETDWVAGQDGQNEEFTYSVADATGGAEALAFDSTVVSGESFWAYAVHCSSCTESGGTQYTDGPWDFLNGESTWSSDVQVVLMREKVSSGTGSWQAAFKMRF